MERRASEDGLQSVFFEEMNKYLAIELTMGFVRFPKMVRHWIESPFYGTKFISLILWVAIVGNEFMLIFMWM
jgi:hypothetical protein